MSLTRLLRSMALSTATFLYSACIPPENDSEEEDLESSCQGEVLFEDEFDGKELDEGKWELSDKTGKACGGRPYGYSELNDGILELHPMTGGCILQSRSTYTLDERTLCFEAQWKVSKREGVDGGVGLTNEDGTQGDISFFVGYGNKTLTCSNVSNNNTEHLPCNTNVEDWATLKFVTQRQGVNYFINERLVASSTQIPVQNIPLNVLIDCQSNDDSEKRCSLDYIKIER